MTILAIDPGKSKSVFCNFNTRTGQVQFGKPATTEAGFIEGPALQCCGGLPADCGVTKPG